MVSNTKSGTSINIHPLDKEHINNRTYPNSQQKKKWSKLFGRDADLNGLSSYRAQPLCHSSCTESRCWEVSVVKVLSTWKEVFAICLMGRTEVFGGGLGPPIALSHIVGSIFMCSLVLKTSRLSMVVVKRSRRFDHLSFCHSKNNGRCRARCCQKPSVERHDLRPTAPHRLYRDTGSSNLQQ